MQLVAAECTARRGEEVDTMDMLRRDGEERWTEEPGRRGGWVAAGAPPAARQGEETGRRGTVEAGPGWRR